MAGAGALRWVVVAFGWVVRYFLKLERFEVLGLGFPVLVERGFGKLLVDLESDGDLFAEGLFFGQDQLFACQVVEKIEHLSLGHDEFVCLLKQALLPCRHLSKVLQKMPQTFWIKRKQVSALRVTSISLYIIWMQQIVFAGSLQLTVNIILVGMQTDKQKLTRLAVNIKQLEEQMSRKGVALNSGVLVDSSDEEDCRDECSGKGTFHSQMSKTLKQYEFRKQFNETWYKQKMEALYRTYNRGTFEVE